MSSPRVSRRSLLAVLSLAAVLRVGTAVALWDRSPVDDENAYHGLAEGIVAGLTPGYTVADFWADWTFGDTQAVRNDANRALVSGPGGIGRGWEVVVGTLHQHEGDGTNTDG